MTTIQRLSPRRWRVPAQRFRVRTLDGIWVAGTRLGNASSERAAAVLAHGLFGWHRKPKLARFAEDLTPWFTVYSLDLRGHGASGGTSTFGNREVEDVEAVVRLARAGGHRRLATIGTSMGAIAVVRHAALVGGVDHVVAISSLARWGPHDDDGHAARARAWRRMRSLTGSPRGRRLVRAYGVRLPATWERTESPEDVVARISPTPLLVVHGKDDHLFAHDEALRLFESAGEPKRLLLAERFGHAEDGLSPALAARLARSIHRGWEPAWPG